MLWEEVSAWFVGLSYGSVQFAAGLLLQSAALIGLGLAAGRLVRSKGAALQSAVYRTTLVAVVLCPAASMLLAAAGAEGLAVVLPKVVSQPEGTVEVTTRPQTEVAPADPVRSADHRVAALPGEPVWNADSDPVAPPSDRPAADDPLADDRPMAPLAPEGYAAAPSPAAVPSMEATPTPVTPATASKRGLARPVVCLLTAAWLVSSCFLLIRLLTAHLGIVRLRRTACEVGSATVAECRAVARRLGVRPPRVRRSPFVTSPCLVGLCRPTLLLAEGEAADGGSERDVIVHELAHLVRRDHVWNLLGHLSVAILFFQPLLWLLLRRIVRTAEEVCDDYVVDFGLDRRDYARRLADIVERFQPHGWPAAVGMISLKSVVGRRIERIVDGSRRLSVRAGVRAAAATVVLGGIGTLLVALLAVGGRPADARADGESAEKPVPADTGDGEGHAADPDKKSAAKAASHEAAKTSDAATFTFRYLCPVQASGEHPSSAKKWGLAAPIFDGYSDPNRIVYDQEHFRTYVKDALDRPHVDGPTVYWLMTPKGLVEFADSMDPRYLGRRFRSEDLIRFLKARISGKKQVREFTVKDQQLRERLEERFRKGRWPIHRLQVAPWDKDLCMVIALLAKPRIEEAYPLIAELLRDSSKTVRMHAVWALGRIGPDAKVAIPGLVACLSDKDLFNDAALSLSRIGTEAVPALIEALGHESRWSRIGAAEALGRIGPDAGQQAVAALKRRLEDKTEDGGVRTYATIALGKMGPAAKPAEAALRRALDDENHDVRNSAAKALQQIAPKQPGGGAADDDRSTAPLRAADLAPPVRITAGGVPIDVDGFAAPFVGDFDGDGRHDLLVGQLDHGRLRIYLNSGTNARPKFDSFQWFNAGGRIASIPAGCVVGFTPQLVDFDGDGRTDIVTGSFAWGLLYVFRRNRDGTFAEAEVLEDKDGRLQWRHYSFENRRIEYNLTVFVHDWDGDGDGDLLLGRGHRGLVPNEGTRRQPVFGDTVPITLDGKPLPSGSVGPCAADWNGDGRDDLLLGRGRDVVWYRNTGTKGRPVLQPPRILVSADGLAPHEDTGPDDQRQRPNRFVYAICVADFNADGRPDLLLGDHYYNRRTLTEEQEAEYTEAAKKRSTFYSEYRRLIRERPENETRPERIERFRKALREFYELAEVPWVGAQASQRWMERHGGVWLYERIAADGRKP